MHSHKSKPKLPDIFQDKIHDVQIIRKPLISTPEHLKQVEPGMPLLIWDKNHSELSLGIVMGGAKGLVVQQTHLVLTWGVAAWMGAFGRLTADRHGCIILSTIGQF